MLVNTKISPNYILKSIRVEMLFVIVIGLLAHYITSRYREFIAEMPLAIPLFIGTAISILLSFKLAQSYDRWWEARKIWGSIVNDSRTLIIQLQSFCKNETDTIRTVALRQAAWCHCLTKSLREQECTRLENLISPEEMAKIAVFNNKPLALTHLQAESIATLRRQEKLDSFQHVQVDETLKALVASMGMAERIKNTVFPLTYRILLHLFIYVFVATLSIAFRDLSSWYEMPLLLILSGCLLLLEKAATQLEKPFNDEPTDTPMASISTKIETDLKQLVGNTDLPTPEPIQRYFIM